ncbi:MAG: alpha/beta hydrolase [Candidatus Omnitrophica bacterium]|nr:alpha/beta hydrolase [Candidatus Omnitrophota bacterium]
MTPSVHAVTTHDGIRVAFDQYAGGRSHVVVVCHGFFQSRTTRVFRQLTAALAEQHDVISLDFRGHGGSSGWFTFSAREGAELDAVLAWGGQRYASCTVMGFSLGGAVAINTVGRHRDVVKGLIAVSAPAAFEDIEFQFWTLAAIRTGLESLGPGMGCRPGNPLLPKQRPVESIATLGGLPVLIIHGAADTIVGVEHGRRLFAAAHEPKRLHVVQAGGHAEILFRDDPEGFLGLVRHWEQEVFPVGG